MDLSLARSIVRPDVFDTQIDASQSDGSERFMVVDVSQGARAIFLEEQLWDGGAYGHPLSSTILEQILSWIQHVTLLVGLAARHRSACR